MGSDDLILGYPWFAATNAHPDWTTGTLPASVLIRTKGVASGKPRRSVRVAGMRTTIRNRPFLETGDELFLRVMKIDPARATKTTVAQQLAEQATDKTVRTWDQIVPPHYHEHAKVFSEEAAHRFPESREWDHAIDVTITTLHSFYRPNADRTDCRSRRGPIPEPAERKADRIPNPLDRDRPRSPRGFADMAPISHR